MASEAIFQLKWSEVLPIGAAMPVIIGGQSMQISDGESHKLVGRVQFFSPCNAELHRDDRGDQNLNAAAQA